VAAVRQPSDIVEIVLTVKHGATSGGPSREYNSWAMMKQRCLNDSYNQFSDYGGRGVQICERWINSFENFLEDMGSRPVGTTLDRWPNKNGSYEPDNCRWATKAQQQSNMRNNIVISIEEITTTMTDWCRMLAVSPKAVGKRLKRGYSPYEALTAPSRRGYRTDLRQI
jgi:hypothetical protein